MRIRFLFATIALLFTWSTFVAVIFAQRIKIKEEIESLRGLQGVRVTVEDIDPEAERDGLTKSQIQRVVESELRKAGIKVLTEEEWFSIPSSAILSVNVNTDKSPESFNISLELVQRVALFRNPYFARLAPTWNTGSVGTVGASNLRNIYDSVKDMVDIFINDYLSVNPK
jgi:hypothetical protein